VNASIERAEGEFFFLGDDRGLVRLARRRPLENLRGVKP